MSDKDEGRRRSFLGGVGEGNMRIALQRKSKKMRVVVWLIARGDSFLARVQGETLFSPPLFLPFLLFDEPRFPLYRRLNAEQIFNCNKSVNYGKMIRKLWYKTHLPCPAIPE